MRFVYDKIIAAQIFKGNKIVLFERRAQLLDIFLKRLPLTFKLFHRQSRALVLFHYGDRGGKLFYFFIVHFLLSFKRQRYLFKLRLRDYNRVVAAR